MPLPAPNEPPSPAEVVWPDFTANALKRYARGYELLVRWYAGLPLSTDERAAAMRASFTRQRLLNEAGYIHDEAPAHEV